MARGKTVIVTGGSQGIGAAIVQAFLERGYDVVATSRSISKAGYSPSRSLALVDGDISHAETAERGGENGDRDVRLDRPCGEQCGNLLFETIHGIHRRRIRALVSTNLDGFVFITQLAVRQMLAQDSGGSVTSISASLADNPMAGVPASVPMMTKGGIDAMTLSLANEYAKEKIRFNAVAPGVVDTPLHKGNLQARSPMGTVSEPKDIANAVVYLTEAGHVTGEVLHVDDGAHVGQW